MWWKEEGTGELNVLVKGCSDGFHHLNLRREERPGMLINGEGEHREVWWTRSFGDVEKQV